MIWIELKGKRENEEFILRAHNPSVAIQIGQILIQTQLAIGELLLLLLLPNQ